MGNNPLDDFIQQFADHSTHPTRIGLATRPLLPVGIKGSAVRREPYELVLAERSGEALGLMGYRIIRDAKRLD
jgi:hypothetical protein